MEELLHQIDVSDDGGTVWVNAGDGSCIGRFSKRFGLDVHNSGTAQLEGAKECLECTHAPAGPAEWDHFCASVQKHHGITVPKDLVQFG